ncbi:MAG: GNAT family N-acetyltransferase [Acidimicrobiales bacterium]
MAGLADPVLQTGLLVMRPLNAANLADMIALYQDVRVTRFLMPLDEGAHRKRLAEAETSWSERGFGPVGLYERATGRFVGRGGLHHWPQFEEVEVGWVLRLDAWGRGYATDSGRAWIAWGFAHTDCDYITANIDPANVASVRVARRLGMSELREDVFHGRDVVVHAVTRPVAASSITRRPRRAAT